MALRPSRRRSRCEGADFQLGVVTTDHPRNGGRLQTGPGTVLERNCTQPPPDLAYCEGMTLADPWLASHSYLVDPSNPASGYTQAGLDQLHRDFACVARAGDCGNPVEAGHAAAMEALSAPLLAGFNAGFVRDNAVLVVVYLSGEDDCSLRDIASASLIENCHAAETRHLLIDVAAVYDALVALKGDPASIVVGALVGPSDGRDPMTLAEIRESRGVPDSCAGRLTEPCEAGSTCPDGSACPDSGVCELGFVNAKAGERYIDLVERFGDHGVFESICQPSFEPAFVRLLEAMERQAATFCVAFDRPPLSCAADADCAAPSTCVRPGPGGGVAGYCGDFEIGVDVAPAGGDTWTALRGAGPVADAATPRADAQYFVDHAAAHCSSGMSVRFAPGHRPAPGSQFRVSYQAALPSPAGGAGVGL